MIQAAIFDLDGTLLDSQWIWTDVGAHFLRSIGIVPQPDLNEILAPMSMEQGCRYFISTYGLSLSVPQITSKIIAIVENFYRNDAKLKPHVKEFIQFIHSQRIKLCVVTATDRSLAAAALERCGISQYFDFLLTASEFGQGKDRPDIFLHAMEQLGGTFDTTLVFEDAPHAIRTAKTAGFSVIGIADPTANRAEAAPLCREYWEEFPESDHEIQKLLARLSDTL